MPVSIDIGFGDVIYPERVKMEFPVLLGMEIPEIYAYTIYSVIAEKFEAIVSLGLANSRYKDFYDIYVITGECNLSGMELTSAIKETFEHRGTGYDDIVAFEEGFAEDPVRQNRWKAFIKKKKALINVSFDEVTEFLKDFAGPIVNAIVEDRAFDRQWNCKERRWN